MAAKKTTTKKAKSTSKNVEAAVKAPASKRGRKPAVKSQKNKVASETPGLQNRMSSVMSSVKLPRVSFKNFRWQKKYGWIIGAVVVVVLLGYLAATKLVIAWVDDTPVTFFQYYGVLDQQYGGQLKEELISQQLVLNEANKRHISVSDQEINDQINTIKQQTAGQGDFNQLLAQQGLTMDSLKQQIKLQLLIKKMFQSQASVSAQEVDDYIAANKDQYPEASAGAKAQVADQLQQQKIISAFQNWLATQQSSGRVRRVQ